MNKLIVRLAIYAFCLGFLIQPARAERFREPVNSDLPVPILDGDPNFTELYWTAWEIALRKVKQPQPGSGFASAFMDDAFSGNIYQWDTCFMVMFGRYTQDVVPGVRSFDNFYARQHADGFIDREIHESDGGDTWGPAHNNAINPPLFSWAEWQTYLLTGEGDRLAKVYPHLKSYYEWVKAHRRWDTGLYWTTNLASGMDNSPRPLPAGDDSGEHYSYSWVDLTAQQALNARHLAKIAAYLGKTDDEVAFMADYEELKRLVNENFWSEEDGIYYDLDENGKLTNHKTAASFWPLLAEIAPEDRAERLVKEHLMNKDEFWRKHPFPTLSADHPKYQPMGGYWEGSVWAPTEYMIIRGLENYGHEDFATAAVGRHLSMMYKVLRQSGSIYENYSPDFPFEGRPSSGDFVGWSGVGPIAMLFENIIGIRADAPADRLTWRIRRTDRHGVEKFHFGDNKNVSIVAAERKDKNDPVEISISTDSPFELVVDYNGQQIAKEIQTGDVKLMIP